MLNAKYVNCFVHTVSSRKKFNNQIYLTMYKAIKNISNSQEEYAFMYNYPQRQQGGKNMNQDYPRLPLIDTII